MEWYINGLKLRSSLDFLSQLIHSTNVVIYLHVFFFDVMFLVQRSIQVEIKKFHGLTIHHLWPIVGLYVRA